MSTDEIAKKVYENAAQKPKLRFSAGGRYRSLKNIHELPLYKFYEHDTSGTVSLGCIISETNGVYNSAIYRIEPISEHLAVIHCRGDSGLGKKIFAGKKITVAVGCSPYLVYTSACSLDDDADELRLAGLLGAEFMQTEYYPVPNDTQVILQGRLTGETAQGGQFFNFTGGYCERGMFPVMEIESVSLAEGGLFQSTVIGIPAMENAFLGSAAARVHFYRLKEQFSEIIDISHPLDSVFGVKTIVKCRKYIKNLPEILKSDRFYGKFAKIDIISD